MSFVSIKIGACGSVPVGWQKIINPRLTRRTVLGGLVTSPVALYARPGEARKTTWYDLEFELSDDQSTLAVLEIRVEASSQPEGRTVACRWQIPVAAFGPEAFFDMAQPDDEEISSTSPAPVRTVYVRNVQFGLRFSKGDKEGGKQTSGRNGRKTKPGFVAFVFTRPGTRWRIAYLTDLWLRTSGNTEAIISGRPAEFRAFLDEAVDAAVDRPDVGAGGPKAPFEVIEAGRIDKTLKATFADLIGTSQPPSGIFRVTLDQHIVWRVSGISGSSLAAQEGKIRISEFSFAWRQPLPGASDDQQPGGQQAVADEVIYFSGEAEPGAVKLTDVAGVIDVGPPNHYHVRLRPYDAHAMRLDAIVGPAPTLPKDLQVVSALSVGAGSLAVASGADIITNGVAGTALIFTQTITPKTKFPRVLRSVLWGNAAGAGPLLGKPTGKGTKLCGRGEIASPVGLLQIGVPVLQVNAASLGGTDDVTSQGANGAGAAPATPVPTAAEVAREGDSNPSEVAVVRATQHACEPGESEPDKESRAYKQLTRLFQAANGDRAGAPDATLHVVHDRRLDGSGSSSMRRIHIDVALFASTAALPDTSYSRLAFKHTDLRLVYEDGEPIAELSGGEYPRPIASSFVWVGPPVAGGLRRAAFDLSRATLTCGRDYDLMKLRFRFNDLVLAYEPDPKIRPAREDARVRVGEDGAVHDSRPILVAEFDPQHVMEEAIFRPEAPPLPDVELTTDLEVTVGGGKTTVRKRESILRALAEAKNSDEQIAIRMLVREAKKAREEEVQKDKDSPTGKAPRPFSDMIIAFAGEASALPEDQKIYIGPFALDPDGMGIARDLMKRIGPTAVRAEVKAILDRVDAHAAPGGALTSKGELLPVQSGSEAEVAYANALRNEAVFEALEPLYGVFRTFWRDKFVTYIAQSREKLPYHKIKETLGFDIPKDADPIINPFLVEYLTGNNRFTKYDPKGGVALLTDLIIGRFVDFALGLDPVPNLQSARLSGKSRLAFRIDCEPASGIDAREAGIEKSSGNGPSRPGAGNSRFSPIPFTFEALTDWSRYEPAVTKRARKLFEALPSGILPRPGSRTANPSDQAMMRFQGFSEAPTTADARMAEVRASLKSERIVNIENDEPFPGEPLDFETAIEIPSRLILSTAQDAIWRTNRRMPPEIYTSQNGEPVAPDPRPIMLEEGNGLAGPKATSAQPRDLWSVRLETFDGLGLGNRAEAVSLRAVASPDLRPTALGGYRTGDKHRLPGQGAPPRGPYAPWFIGPEQMESGTLTAQEIAAAAGADPNSACPVSPAEPNKFGLIRWLCERAGFREALPAENYTIFRTSLDAFDRHQLVLLSSAYGLPVIGKRKPAAGADPDDVESSGGLIAASGQIEPGKSFSLLDATEDQALHKPVPLNVKSLSLTALGGSFLHDTAFKPSAGANDLFGRKIFEGFSIDTLQQDIILGRDIRTEVVYKGYLLPLGHKASFVKLTERIFLRTPEQGIKAMLRQRMFCRMAEPNKIYGALGQPHGGRMWCGKYVRLIADKTPDILDPTFPLDGEPTKDKPEALNGRIYLGTGPGLAFWPRTDITERGLYRFEITIDGTPTSLPMLFLDNIAATTAESVKAAVDYYNDTGAAQIARRTLQVGGSKIDFAPNSKAGEAQFETNFIRIRAHGRSRTPNTTSWTGMLEDQDNFVTTGILEGADQPSFYPAMEFAEIRLGSVERMSGGAPNPVEVQYDGHYVLYGFPGDPVPRGLPEPKNDNANPKEVFLNLRKVVTLGMGNNGDRSGGIARPETHIVAISRSKGPLGGDESTWWSMNRADRKAPSDNVEQQNGKPKEDMLQSAMPVPTATAIPTLVSLAPYFNEVVSRPTVKPLPLPQGSQSPFPLPSPETASDIVKQVQSFFSLDAKLLGTIKFKDLMWLLGLDVNSIPVLKEVQEFGTAALRSGNERLNNLSNDVRSRVLVPLRDVIVLLRTEWSKLDAALREKQIKLPTLARQQPDPLRLADIYPEVDGGLEQVEGALTAALATEDALSLIPKLAAIHSSARELIRGLAILASNPVERLEEAITGNLRERISALTGALETLAGIVGQLDEFKKAFLDEATDQAGQKIANWIFEKIAGTVPANSTVEIEAGNRLVEVLPLASLPPDLSSILKTLITDVETSANSLWVAIAGSAGPPATPGIGQKLTDEIGHAAREAMGPMIKAAITDLLKGDKLEDVLKARIFAYSAEVKGKIKKAKEDAREALEEFITSSEDAESNAARALQAALDRYTEQLLDVAIDTAIDNYPDEVQALIAGLERLNTAIDSGKKVAEAVKGGEPKDILQASGAFAQEVLGIDVESVKGGFNTRVTGPVLTAVKEASKGMFEEGPLRFDPNNAPILLKEIGACAPIREDPPKAATLPIETNEQVEASCDLLLEIGEAIKALNKVRGELPKVRESLDDPTIEAAGIKSQLISFNDRLTTLISGENPITRGLIFEVSDLYCNIVDFQVAARDLNIAALATDLEKSSVEQIGALLRHIRMLTNAIGDGIERIIGLLGTFLENPENQPIIAAGLVIGGTVVYLERNGVNLSDLAEHQFFTDLKSKAVTWESSIVTSFVTVVTSGLKLISTSMAGARDGIDSIKQGVREVTSTAARFGFSLEPESSQLVNSLDGIKSHLEGTTLAASPTTLKQLKEATLSNGQSLEAFFKTVGATSPYRQAGKALRDLEAALLREWRSLQKRIEGAPAPLKVAAEDAFINTGVFKTISDGYKIIGGHRDTLLTQAGTVPILAPFARQALLVQPHPGLAILENEDLSKCNVDDVAIDSNTLIGCDRLAQEVSVLTAAQGLPNINPDERPALRRRIVVLFRNWGDGQAAPLLLIDQAGEMAKDLLRGNVFAAIDLGAFRDQIEDAISGLIPTKVNLSYDFNSIIDKNVDDQAIFQPKHGSDFGIVLRASVDLLDQKTDFSATAHIGPFDIYLIGGVVDALRLKFGGAAFAVRSSASSRFDVIYEDFKIGRDLEFAQQLQSYLTPKEGSGIFVQPMTRSAGVEAGYSINLGTIGVGATSFFNVSLNVSAELPFGNEESLFKVSLGRRLAPFSMGIFPFAGSGYFSIYAAADGVRGFEAAFEYGGGGAIGFGPLTADCRIQVGVFVRILKVNGVKKTEMYGTFFAGGSASIWIFHFGASLYVRLGTADNGAMYGEAIYTFSFSLGIADYDYSITAYKKEKPLGSGQQQQASHDLPSQPTRLAALSVPSATLTDVIDAVLAEGLTVEVADKKESTGAQTTGLIVVKAADQSVNWNRYASYFDVSLVDGLVP